MCGFWNITQAFHILFISNVEIFILILKWMLFIICLFRYCVICCFRFFVVPYILNILGLNLERSIKSKLKNSFLKKKEFTRFVKSKLSTTKDGKLEVEILKGQESFRIKSFVKSNIWVLLPAGKSKFKKGDIVDCFFPNQSNQTLI